MKPRLSAAVAAVVAGLALVPASPAHATAPSREPARSGATRPGVQAYFLTASRRQGSWATLAIEGSPRSVTVQLFRVGTRPIGGLRRDELRGTAVSEPLRVRFSKGARQRRVRLAIGGWPSGMHYAELRSPGGRIGYAPLVVVPRTLGESRVAVVMPTNMWAAYNRRDSNGDGVGDTWYEDRSRTTVDLTRPFLDRGVPPYFHSYDLGFLRWLVLKEHEVDYLSDRELESLSGTRLAAEYDLIVFPGHHEYVTAHSYDAVERFRDLGGNLMFLSANNFFYRVLKRGDTMTRTERWRDLGRPEASLVGVQFIRFVNGHAPYRIRSAPATSWVFAGTGLGPGARFSRAGIEIDGLAGASPPGTQVLAEIPNLLGTGLTAQMSFYRTPRGAEVFAAGAFTMGGAALWPDVSQVLENLWARLAVG